MQGRDESLDRHIKDAETIHVTFFRMLAKQLLTDTDA
jgi:hypothetical protein